MEKMELYHFHKENNNDKFWHEKNTIIVTDKFYSTTYKRFKNFSTKVQTSDNELINFEYLLPDIINTIDIMTKDEIRNILLYAHKICFDANEFKREQALENYRLQNAKNLPSRLHSMYLTDELGIEYWKNAFGNAKLTLYRVEAEGNIFKTNEQLIPEEHLCYQDAFEAAQGYWNPRFKNVPNYTNEYLTQGKIRVLEKIEKF